MLNWLRGLGRKAAVDRPVPSARTHVILLDGTLSSVEPGRETSIGLIFKMLEAQGAHCLHYEPGIGWRGWRALPELMAGVGINAQIRRAYAWLATSYLPGDRVFLLGYSRGAYAARALSGMIDRVGLLQPEHVNDDTVWEAYHHYREDPTRAASRSFAARLCHPRARITAVGVFDTVQAVGIRWPILWRLFPQVHAFRSHRLGQSVGWGFHAMALDETRRAYKLDRWRTHGTRTATVEQLWFRGTHGDLGGQLYGYDAARPLANVPLVWMLERLESVGLELPANWRGRFPHRRDAPSAGNWRGLGWIFVTRGRRTTGIDDSEALHPTAFGHPKANGLRLWNPPHAVAAVPAETG
ncbi:DUF2235 domain-containing protein [Jannaschia ovalis]|uniref:DUF2235 domain-containing protein n=1 Tax=Jannaschia ovalis TaxID=3038773 RepID=A0ABY8LDF5_9RHOB|nr:DUF2235 domain-containing protein [Jannaschia sp. GRR-S6-38]WGH78408.1 DUF2235 domain-containing protein [Jannaschia sp. GRR-S6-38]